MNETQITLGGYSMNKIIKKIILLTMFVGCCSTLLLKWVDYSGVQMYEQKGKDLIPQAALALSQVYVRGAYPRHS